MPRAVVESQKPLACELAAHLAAFESFSVSASFAPRRQQRRRAAGQRRATMTKQTKKKEKIAKPPSRAMKCVAAWLKAQLWIVNLFFVLAGGVLVWLGVSSSPAATLIPETVAVGSIVMGAITLLFSLCACCGILKGSKPAMCPYACLLIIVMVIDAAAIATLFQTEALECPGGGCSAANATGVAALNVSGALADVRSRDAVLMLGLYREFDSMYSYCRPRNASTMWRPFTERGALGDVALACQDAQLASFGAWVSDECLAPAASWDAAPEDEMLRVPVFEDTSSDDSESDVATSFLTGDDDASFIQRLVREVSVEDSAASLDSDSVRALRDVSVSGMNGWVRVTRVGHSRGDACAMRVRVLGPRGLEVFDREPMPVT